MSGFIAPALCFYCVIIMQLLFKRLVGHKAFLPLCCLLAADIVVFGGTHPQEVSSYLLIIGFLLVCATVYCLLKGVVSLLTLVGMPIRHRQRAVKVGTALCAACLALQSVGQLSPQDVLVLSLLIGLLYLYTAYRKNPGPNLR